MSFLISFFIFQSYFESDFGCFSLSFDLELEKWGVYVEVVKEPAVMWHFNAWTEDWE